MKNKHSWDWLAVATIALIVTGYGLTKLLRKLTVGSSVSLLRTYNRSTSSDSQSHPEPIRIRIKTVEHTHKTEPGMASVEQTEIPSEEESPATATLESQPEPTTPEPDVETSQPVSPQRDFLAPGVWKCPVSLEDAACIGSDDRDKFHLAGCRWAENIKPENRICFASREAALAYDYKPCGTCKP
ncbi:MAG: hypothetical protein JW981_05145 [Anaerolineae bacterium]|nr:hypothetical protein [Anaerolineae bacterium]